MTKIWYVVEYSAINEDDWYDTSATSETIKSARERMTMMRRQNSREFEYRLVRKEMTSTVIGE